MDVHAPNKHLKDVILAEDDYDDVLIFDMASKQIGIPVTIRHAENGDTLFVLLKQRVPDMLFLDIDMPCKDGVSCILEIRRNKDYDSLPVIIFTAYHSEHYINDCFRNGANMYMMKTGSIGELVTNLKNIFAIDWKKNMYYPPRDRFIC